MPRSKEVTITIKFDWEDADHECGINAGYLLTDIVYADNGKSTPEFSNQFYQELTEKLS
jgi:hypothetical protein